MLQTHESIGNVPPVEYKKSVSLGLLKRPDFEVIAGMK
jgi:hypothetical protein